VSLVSVSMPLPSRSKILSSKKSLMPWEGKSLSSGLAASVIFQCFIGAPTIAPIMSLFPVITISAPLNSAGFPGRHTSLFKLAKMFRFQSCQLCFQISAVFRSVNQLSFHSPVVSAGGLHFQYQGGISCNCPFFQ